ncbi:MAG: LptA/OstA family protein [Bacteroidota bacterium]
MSARARWGRLADTRMGVTMAIVLAGMALLALGAEAATEKVVVTADKRVTIDFDADVTVFEGNVRISYSDVIITADRAEVKGRKTATITGSVKLTQPDITLTGDVLTAYISERRVIVEGGVTLTKDEERAGDATGTATRTATGTATGAKERVVVTCDRMELRTNTRGFVAAGNVEMRRGDTFACAERATYTEKDRLAILEGNVIARGKNQETVKCGKLLFRTDRDHMEAMDKVTLEFEVEEEE